MLGLFNSIGIGSLFCLLFLLVMGFLSMVFERYLIFKNWCTLIVAIALSFAIPCLASIRNDRHVCEKYMSQFEVEKQIIEGYILTKELSNSKYASLVQYVAKTNKELAAYKYDCQQWYGIAIPDEIMDIEFISLEG